MKPFPRISSPGLGNAVRRRRSTHDAAVQAIGIGIVNGRYPAGSLLPPSDELLSALSMSRTTLREALQTLAAKGMIVARAKVGTRVLDEGHWNMFDADILEWRLATGIPASFLSALFEVRQSLEPVAAALAAARRTPEDVDRLRELANGLGLARRHFDEFVDADVLFHQFILEVSRNPFMNSLGALISTALRASFTLSAPALRASFTMSAPLERQELSALVKRQHMDIVDAIEAGDPQAANDAMMTVIRQGWINYSGQGYRVLARTEVATFQGEPA